ncbi:MAG TPA: fused MFS/spermidine synthase [Verrucomicrobiae bacterium]|nr:fused MFS/spermidine synthase [Verrucomicrobiae bacterium]
MPWYFIFFLISGFCSVLYELVWLRLCMAQFGVTTAMVSIVLSVFMAGLGVGSWGSGRAIRRWGEKTGSHALRVYALIEFLTGIGGVVVPVELSLGHGLLERLGDSSSPLYYVASGSCVFLTLIPWCVLMGATIPVAMLALGTHYPRETAHSFSFLYMANVAGAVAGTRVPLYLIELLGFHGTLRIGTACNTVIAGCVLLVSLRRPTLTAQSETPKNAGKRESAFILLLLFATGLTSMGMELVWIRQFTPFLGNVVYGFSSILGVYLAATFLGSVVYRRWSRNRESESAVLWSLLAVAAILPLVTAKPALRWDNLSRLIFGIGPFTGLLGFITPMLVDRWSRGDPDRAGSAYAVNVVGCILGPLVAGFGLLPWISERWALVLLASPWIAQGLKVVWNSRSEKWTRAAPIVAYATIPILAVIIWKGGGYEDRYPGALIKRDSTATVIATGSGMNKKLLVNGYGMTVLTPITKMMAHLPLTLLDRKPTEVLDICFGMGTTFRSLLSWNVHTTAVELDPSVPQLFGYFHQNGPELLKSPVGKVVIDDGRRYLERTTQQYDLITIDPPPPVEAAGSSMLYSIEFYAAARRRLRPGGIVEQWVPNGDAEDLSAMAQAFKQSFPYVKVFRWGPTWQIHLLGSDQPIVRRSAEEMLSRMPQQAIADLTEWDPTSGDRYQEAIHDFSALLARAWDIDAMIAESPNAPPLRDDRPINEYYVLRRGSVALSTPH